MQSYSCRIFPQRFLFLNIFSTDLILFRVKAQYHKKCFTTTKSIWKTLPINTAAFNPLMSSVTFIYSLKTSEKHRFSDAFWGYKNVTLDINGLRGWEIFKFFWKGGEPYMGGDSTLWGDLKTP